jgi:hypothetical protein
MMSLQHHEVTTMMDPLSVMKNNNNSKEQNGVMMEHVVKKLQDAALHQETDDHQADDTAAATEEEKKEETTSNNDDTSSSSSSSSNTVVPLAKKKEPLNETCPCCGKQSKLLCTRCRSQRYCSRDCQKSHWASHHKSSCKSVVANTNGRSIVVDLEEMEEHPNTSTFIIKVQVALHSQVKSPMIAYDQPRSLGMVLIHPMNCHKAILLETTIHKYGPVGGAKAYFNAKLRPKDKKLILYLDQRHDDLTW